MHHILTVPLFTQEACGRSNPSEVTRCVGVTRSITCNMAAEKMAEMHEDKKGGKVSGPPDGMSDD